MLEEITKSLKAALYERTTSSFIGSLIVFWLYFNWDLSLVLFLDDVNIKDRIANIRKEYVDIYSNYWWPILSATAYSIIYPYIAIGFYSIARHANSLKIIIRNNIENTTTIPLDEFINLKKEIVEKENEFSDLLETRSINENNLIKQLEAEKDINAETTQKLNDILNMQEGYTLFSKGIEKKAKKDIDRLLGEMLVHVSTEHTNGFYYYCSHIYNKVNQHTRTNTLQSLHSAWFTTLRDQASKGLYVNIYHEIDVFWSNFLHIAEEIRNDVKNAIKNKNIFENIISPAKEDWDVVRMDLNSITTHWKRILENEYTNNNSNIDSSKYYPILKSIEDE